MKKIKQLLFYLFFTSLFFYLINYEKENLKYLFSIDFSSIIALFIINWVSIFNGAFLNYIYYRKFNFGLSFLQACSIFINRYFLNFFPLRAGSIATAVYLGKKHKISFKYQIIIFGTIAYIGVLSQLLFGFILSFILLLQNVIIDYYSLLFFGLSFISGIIIFFLLEKFLPFLPVKILEKVENIRSGYNKISNKKFVVTITILYYAISLVLSSLKIFIFAQFLNYDYSFSQIIFMMTAINISNFFAITPGNLGVKEVLSGVILAYYGGAFDEGILLSIADRGVDIISSFILWLIYSKSINLD